MAGGGLAILRTDDRVRLDVSRGTLDVLVADEELRRRWEEHVPVTPENHTPWQEIYRSTVGQLADGGCMELATRYARIAHGVPRNNH